MEYSTIFMLLTVIIIIYVLRSLINFLRNPTIEWKIKILMVLIFGFMIIEAFWPFIDLYLDSDLNPFDYARITDVNYKAVVIDEPNNSGKVKVTERLTFDIHALSKDNLYWELWRALPESEVDGLKVDYKVNSVKQILDDGTEVIYDESDKLYWDDYDYINTSGGYGPGKWYHSEGPYSEYNRQYECVLFYVDGLYRDKVTFEIEYEMNSAAFRYNDCSQLYLPLYSEETIKYLNSYKGQILFANKDMPKVGDYEVHTNGTNYYTFPYTESDELNPGYHTFVFNLDKSDLKFKNDTQFIEFILTSYGEDKHIFTEYAPDNYYSTDDVLSEIRKEQAEYDLLKVKYNERNKFAYTICFIGSIFVIVSYYVIFIVNTRKYTFYKPSQEIEYYRDIPEDLDPYFVSQFVLCKHKTLNENKDGYSSIMLSLIRKRYIELEKINNNEDWKSNNILIKLLPIIENEYEIEPLTQSENLYYNLITRYATNSSIKMSDFQIKVSKDYENTNSFVENLEKSVKDIGISKGYFQTSNYERPKEKIKVHSRNILMIVGFIILFNLYIISFNVELSPYFILFGICIASTIILRILSKKYILLTQLGEDEYVKWRGLYNFLNSETLMSERTVIELPLWEKYLVYATAFGISKKVIKALKIRCQEVNLSPMLGNTYYCSRAFYITNSRAFYHSTHSASRAASYSGYGYGGGRGGGGGRRWTLK